jgi:hypothetical protein
VRGLVTKVLVGVGAFLLTIAALAAFWAPGQVKRTPLDTNSVTKLSGEATLNGTERVAVKATSVTHADSAKSTGDVILFQNSSCLVKNPDGNAPDCVSADDPDKRLITASTSSFATDRRTALAVPDFKALPPEAERREGLINKFPFDVEKKTYKFWDGYLGQAVDATFAGEETVKGLKTYKFLTSVRNGSIEIADGVPGLYDDDKTMWIDPKTGAIQNQVEHMVQKSATTSAPVIDLQFGFTDETIAANVASAKTNGSQLSLLTSTVPLIAGVLGLVALVAGLVMARGLGSGNQPSGTRGRSRTSAPATA